MLNPRKMCSQHLLGEHVEIHMLVGTLRRKRSIDGFILKGLLEVHNARRRHDELAAEMRRRGFKHASPLRRFRARRLGKVNRRINAIELARRCHKCRALLKKD
ncbi:MAG TPA: pyrimidine dimer DNA glycosylase/endonuclease V [Terriglobales bacterium]|nr:pyrimidine dimer DNA glycosylase/endonuclease V [Terriglobales bacterium]